MTLSPKSLERLKGVHPDLVRVVTAAVAASPVTFQVSEGLRTAERQRELVKAGASQTMNSRHLTGHAVDLVILNDDGSADWHFPHYATLAGHIKKTAASLGFPIEWGGDWKSLRDGPHFQLPFAKYP